MGMASLILGIFSIILSFVPFVRILMFLPAVVGIILGSIELFNKRKEKQKSEAIVGIVFSSISIVFIVFFVISNIVFGILSGINMIVDEIEDGYNNNLHIYEEHFEDYEYYNYDQEFERFKEFNSIINNDII